MGQPRQEQDHAMVGRIWILGLGYGYKESPPKWNRAPVGARESSGKESWRRGSRAERVV